MVSKKIIILVLFFAQSVMASTPEVVDVKVEITPAQKYNFSVTIEHEDSGWDHYANAWRVYSPQGKLLGERILHHPHVKEQPFTRTLRGVRIPVDIDEVIIKASCSVKNENEHGYIIKLK